MGTLIELTKDVWTFGCKGDVIRLAKEELARLDEVAKKFEGEVYKVVEEVKNAASRAANAAEAEVVATNTTATKKTK